MHKANWLVLIILAAAMGCSRTPSRSHRQWYQTCEDILAVLQDYVWKHGKLPISYEEVRAQCESYPSKTRPMPGDIVSWKRIPGPDQPDFWNASNGEIEITIEADDLYGQHSVPLPLDFNAKENPWYVHQMPDSSGQYEVVDTEQNCANFIARQYLQFAEDRRSIFPISIEQCMNSNSRIGDFNRLRLEKRFSVAVKKLDVKMWEMKVKSLESGKIYRYETQVKPYGSDYVEKPK